MFRRLCPLVALVAGLALACSSPSSDDAVGDNQHLTGDAPSSSNAGTPTDVGLLTEGDSVAAEVILRQVVEAKMLQGSQSYEILIWALEGSGDSPFFANVTGVSCEASLGTKTCQIQIGSGVKNPGPDEDDGGTLYGLNVVIYQGKISQATMVILAG